MKHLEIFESYQELDHKDQALLKRMLSHEDSWRKILEEITTKDKFERFAEHFKMLDFINSREKDMLKLLLPLVDKSQLLRDWIADNKEDFPEEFKKKFGLYSGMKDLGF